MRDIITCPRCGGDMIRKGELELVYNCDCCNLNMENGRQFDEELVLTDNTQSKMQEFQKLLNRNLSNVNNILDKSALPIGKDWSYADLAYSMVDLKNFLLKSEI